jgi:hypothetical protein
MRPASSNRCCGRRAARRGGLGVLVLLSLSLLALPAAATSAGPPVAVTCNGGGCSANWYTVGVTVAFSWDPTGVTSTSGCNTRTVSSDTSGITYTCSLTYSNGATSSLPVTIKRDATPPTVTGASAGRGPDANGWYNSPVGIAFNGTDATSGLSGCTSTAYSGPDTAAVSFSGNCTDQAGNASGSLSFGPIKYDSTGPSVSGSLTRGPDANGWYNRPVGFVASGSDGLSGVASCNSGNYSGPDIRGGSLGASCTDQAGNTGSTGIGINYDATPPSVTGVGADRQPDSNGWYNHPVAIAFTGRDDTSGVAACTNVTYSGPDSSSTTLNGSCADAAGNRSTGSSLTLKYDSTPPTLTDVGVEAADSLAILSWVVSPDTKSIEILRSPGPSGPDPGVVFTGLASSYEDATVTNHVRYVYTITAFDEAGNTAAQTISVTPAALLYSPARGAVVKVAPLLAWKSVPRTSYYNVQLYFGTAGLSIRRVHSVSVSGRKVLSAWPAQPRFHLRKQWVFKGKHYKLTPGHYTWYVWPGVGKRAAAKYGKLIGKSDFIVSR